MLQSNFGRAEHPDFWRIDKKERKLIKNQHLDLIIGI
jgi:hypothetical protein